MPDEETPVVPSENKLSDTWVNSRPTKESFEKAFEPCQYQHVDVLNVLHWQNEEDTAVIQLDNEMNEDDLWNHLAWYAAAVARVRPDEYTGLWHNEGLLVRMWWD